MTVSRSGEIDRPQCSKSSPVFTIAVESLGGEDAGEAVQESRAADAAGEGDDRTEPIERHA